MQVISLFSGIGGFEFAAEWTGWDNVVSCEINDFGNRVLSYYWPDAYHHKDIKDLTRETIEKNSRWNSSEPTIVVGGFPCQPYSLAGKRLGKDDERHLWPEMLRVIREIQPRYVVGENVSGPISWNGGMVFDEVQADLEAAGYEVIPFVLPACGVNAPHRRDRVWFIAYSIGARTRHWVGESCNKDGRTSENRRTGIRFKNGAFGADGYNTTGQTPENPLFSGCVHREPEQNRTEIREQRDACTGNSKRVCLSEGAAADTGLFRQEIGQVGTMGTDELCESGATADTQSTEQKSASRTRTGREGFTDGDTQCDAADTEGERRTPRLSGAKIIRPQIESGLYGRSSDEIGGCGTWDNFPTQPPVRCRNDGLSTELSGITVSKHRNESIKAYGNAIVPQVAYQIFKAINEYEQQNQ